MLLRAAFPRFNRGLELGFNLKLVCKFWDDVSRCVRFILNVISSRLPDLQDREHVHMGRFMGPLYN